jgi:uncharacterized protein YbcV (DUF1398 family)
MNTTTNELILQATEGSNQGRLHFGQVVALMAQAGVESYLVDYRARQTICYLANGEFVRLALEVPAVEIPEPFDAEGVKAAIRGAQQGTVMYPEFKRLSMRAGCVGYTVWIAGRHVSYFGRKGEVHVEAFPD